MSEQSIELDCAPGYPRPSDLIEDVLKDTGLQVKETCMRLFGNWKWDYSDVPADDWNKAKPIIKERVTHLYHSGIIRYGSW